MNRGSTPCFSPARKMIQSRSQSPDKGMSSGIVSTRVAAPATGAITGLKKSPVKLKTKKKEMMANGANFAERKCRFRRRLTGRKGDAVRENFRGNFIFDSPRERWPMGHQINPSNLGARTFCPHFLSLAFYRYAWPNDFQRTVRHLKSGPSLRWRFDCDGCCFLVI